MTVKRKRVKTTNPLWYACIYRDMVRAARRLGYALALHGSMQKDFDVIAIPWREQRVASPAKLLEVIALTAGGVVAKGWTRKPHGRLAATIILSGDLYIDLGVMPKGAGMNSTEEGI